MPSKTPCLLWGIFDRSQFLPILITGVEGLLIEEANRYTDVQKHYLPELIREIRPVQDLSAIAQIRRILRQERRKDPHMPLIVHTHSSKAGIGKMGGTTGRNPCNSSLNSWVWLSPVPPLLVRWSYLFAEWITARITTHFIAVSAANITTGLRY